MADPIEYLDPEATPDRGADADDVVDTAPAPRGRRRARLAAAVIAGAALLTVLVARAATSDGRHEPRPTPVRTVALPAPPAAVLRLVLATSQGRALAAACAGDPSLPGTGEDDAPRSRDTGGTLGEHDGAVTSCAGDASDCPQATDGLNACETRDSAPAAVAAAVQRRFPDARLASVRTESIRENGNLWYRTMLWSLGERTALRVEVMQHQTNGPQLAELDGVAGRYSRAVTRHGTLDVVITTAGPAGSRSTLDLQQRLADDPALVTP